MLSGLHSATPAGMVTPAWSRIDTRPHAFLSSSRELVATLKVLPRLLADPIHLAVALGASAWPSPGSQSYAWRTIGETSSSGHCRSPS